MGKYQELYDYVKENLGTKNISFSTKVGKQEFILIMGQMIIICQRCRE